MVAYRAVDPRGRVQSIALAMGKSRRRPSTFPPKSFYNLTTSLRATPRQIKPRILKSAKSSAVQSCNRRLKRRQTGDLSDERIAARHTFKRTKPIWKEVLPITFRDLVWRLFTHYQRLPILPAFPAIPSSVVLNKGQVLPTNRTGILWRRNRLHGNDRSHLRLD